MSTALYRLYRPQKFEEVEGQPSAVDVLIKSISTDRAAHAYLFSGARGCGKTTVARLVAKSLNCTSPIDKYEPCCKCLNCTSIANGEHLDVIEIDGASNNGVEEIRELKSHVSLAPFNSRFKVYIIDEVHMLSTAAFNALLKTLEEPPQYVVFILATTEPHKIPVTIRSRCQHIPFQRIRSSDIFHRLEFVCKKERLEYENEALSEIARQADGALRDALSLLDQVMSFGKGVILLDDVSALIGGGSLVALQRWLSIWRKGGEESFLQLNDMFQRGASAHRVIEELFYISRNLWITKEFGAECIKNAGISKEESDYVVEECELWNSKSLESLMVFLTKLLPQVRMGMRTDVIVGILMSRRSAIINAEEYVNDTDLKRIEKSEQKPVIPIERKTGRNSTAQNNLSKNEDIDIKTIDSDSVPVIQAPQMSNPDDITYNAGAASFSTEEGFSPLDDEIRDKILTNLKSNEFALFCALLDSDFLYNPEQNKFCMIVKHNYLFHFLSSGRYSAIFSGIIRAEYPQCVLLIVCGEKLNEFGEVYTAKVNSKEEKKKSEPESPIDAPSDKTIVEKTSSVLYDAARNALKFMRGEIVMHRITSDKPEEMDIS
jgi:DNA polymerase-3 subunit gamma/tau